MPWNSISPIGTISVKANRPKMQENTTYTEVTMGNEIVGTNTVTTRDHFWDVGANEDGRHRFMQSPGFTVGGNPTVPELGTGMDGVHYLKFKEAIEAPAVQKAEPFHKTLVNTDIHLLQLGFRVMCYFKTNGAGAFNIPQGDILYTHNVKSQAAPPVGVENAGLGVFVIRFENPLPSENYLVQTGYVNKGSNYIITVGNITTKLTTSVTILVSPTGSSFANFPDYIWISIIGG